MGLGYTPDIGNYHAYCSHSNLPGVLRFLKSSKYMFVATNHQADDLPNTGTAERDEENEQLQMFEADIVTCEYHTQGQ